MLQSLFSTRSFQQLMREGKLASNSLKINSTLLILIVLPSFILSVFYFFRPNIFDFFSPIVIFGITFGVVVICFLTSQFLLHIFCTLFEFHEQKFFYTAAKTLFRFYNATLLIFVLPLFWFTLLPKLIFFLYIPLFLLLFLSFFIRFVSNINTSSRIHFFIYFCTLEILPYILIVKWITVHI